MKYVKHQQSWKNEPPLIMNTYLFPRHIDSSMNILLYWLYHILVCKSLSSSYVLIHAKLQT